MLHSKAGHIFRISFVYVSACWAEKLLFRKTVGRLIAKIPIKKQSIQGSKCYVSSNHQPFTLIAGENLTFSSINSALKAKVIMKFFSLIKELEVTKGLSSLEASLFDRSDKCFLVPLVSYSQLNVV